MTAEIISIGTELLVGSLLNTNACFLAKELAHHGIDVYRQTTVGDNPNRILQAFEEASGRADILITSGGLGPTEDDVTMRCLSQFTGRLLYLHTPTYRHIVHRLKARGLSMTKMIQRQCYVPEGAVIFDNENGTAPGVLCEAIFNGDKKWILVLPGPPRELQPLFLKKGLPSLFQKAGIKREPLVIRSVRISGLIEAQVAQKVTDLLKLKPPLTVGIYAKPAEVELKIMVKSDSRKEALLKARRVEKKIRKRLGRHVYGVDEETLSSAVGKLLKAKRKTLAAAESCTGGLLSSRLTDVPRSSDYFLGSLVAYHNRIKVAHLDIPPGLLKKYGAVSAPVAKKMAQNIRKKYAADIGIGITGIAGPSGGSRLKPVGLVYIALSTKNKTFCRKKIFLGARHEIKSRAADEALNILRSLFAAK